MKNLKKAIAPIAMAAVMLATSALPASAARTVKYTFTQNGRSYGITTRCTGFTSYVTANAQVKNRGITRNAYRRAYKNATATATMYCPSGAVYRSGWFSL